MSAVIHLAFMSIRWREPKIHGRVSYLERGLMSFSLATQINFSRKPTVNVSNVHGVSGVADGNLFKNQGAN